MADTNEPMSAFNTEAGAAITEVQVDTSKLTALSPEVIGKQATVRVESWIWWQMSCD